MTRAATQDEIARDEVSWVVMCEPQPGLYICAEWQRGEPAPNPVQLSEDVAALRTELIVRQNNHEEYLDRRVGLGPERRVRRWYSFQLATWDQWWPEPPAGQDYTH